jgi:hypothetical protein
VEVNILSLGEKTWQAKTGDSGRDWAESVRGLNAIFTGSLSRLVTGAFLWCHIEEAMFRSEGHRCCSASKNV